MAITSTAAFVDALRAARILQLGQIDEVARLQPRFADPRLLAKDLIARGWLTPYQINLLFQGQAKELVLGSYVILERLGEGAMGLVYKARHQTMGRVVALKVIRPDRLKHPNAVRRFEREVRALAQLSHPNVVVVYDADQVNGSHFLAMEYLEGVDLGKLVKQAGPLPIVPACDYIRQSALCLQYVFERGQVHRDIKPSNIMLVPPAGQVDARARMAPTEGVIKVLDMGLARIEETESGESSYLTQEGLMIGTPDFIAPEQARNSHTADIRADLYSLGCTFFFLLTGKPPFTATSVTQKLLQHQEDPPPRVEQLRPEVPTAVSVIIRRLMAKRPADRYQTPAELARDLSYVLTTGGLPPSVPATARRDAVLQVAGPPEAPAHHSPFVPLNPIDEAPRTSPWAGRSQGQSFVRSLIVFVVVLAALFVAVRYWITSRSPPRKTEIDYHGSAVAYR